jgi:photosystem II stability/assembly factor-like uncharacterized protein
MRRSLTVVVALLVAACTAAPLAPSISSAPPATVAAARPTPSPIATSSPTPSASRTPIPLPNTAEIAAPSGTVVWVWVGDQNGRLFRSTDRGETWRESTLPPIAPAEVTFIDDREGWAMVPTGGCCVAPPAGGQCGAPVMLSHTTDGGMTWQELVPTGLTPPGPCKSTIRFADPQRGFIAAYDPAGSPAVYRTVDGGRSWTVPSRLPDPPGFTTRAAQRAILGVRQVNVFGTTLLLHAAATDPAPAYYVYRSTDSGATWVYASTPPDRTQPVTFVTATRWLQIAAPGDSKETTDGGASWHAFATDYQQAAPIAPTIVFGDAQTGYATVRGAIQRTIDGGAHWTAIKTPGTF